MFGTNTFFILLESLTMENFWKATDATEDKRPPALSTVLSLAD